MLLDVLLVTGCYLSTGCFGGWMLFYYWTFYWLGIIELQKMYWLEIILLREHLPADHSKDLTQVNPKVPCPYPFLSAVSRRSGTLPNRKKKAKREER
jgi:hypothetical protein